MTEPKFELGETAMNEALLRDLAATTGGAFFREEDLHKLPDTISAKNRAGAVADGGGTVVLPAVLPAPAAVWSRRNGFCARCRI